MRRRGFGVSKSKARRLDEEFLQKRVRARRFVPRLKVEKVRFPHQDPVEEVPNSPEFRRQVQQEEAVKEKLLAITNKMQLHPLVPPEWLERKVRV